MGKTLRERLRDKDEIFTRDEIYAAFEELCEEYGFHRNPVLPNRSQTVETASMTVKGFEDLPMIVVRPRTNRDAMLTIPSLADKLLGDNLNPSSTASMNALVIATAQAVIVSPPDLVERLLNSDNPNDIQFFYNFFQEYNEWMNSRAKQAIQKKSGRIPGSESASMSAPTTA